MTFNKKIIYIVLGILFSMSFMPGYLTAEQWLYTNPLDTKDMARIEKNPDSFSLGDVAFEAHFCGSQKDLICIKSRGFQFAVPRDINNSPSSWSFNKQKYIIKGKNTLTIFGDKYDVFLIDEVLNENKLRFLYSSTNGLIGFGGISNKKIYLINSKCGFGASKRCKNNTL